MRFAVLGPLEVDDGTGRRFRPTGARLRVLLTTLLLHANTPVASDVLAEAVWDGALPPAALVTLRSYVRRLRQSLGPDAETRIVARDPGYLIRVEQAELDVLGFEALCRQAGEALRKRAWLESSEAAARALELWRGAPLLDIPSQALHARFVPRFEQLRVQALEDRADADLQLGRYERLVPELQELTAAYPLRERFHAQLMVVLARSGRQAEALQAYQKARRVLVDDLGIEPGPELRDLHQRVLAGDASVVAADPKPLAAAQKPVPRQLPATTQHFTGRHDELAMIAGLLNEPGGAVAGGGPVVISAIDGMAGIGKTALAVHAAQRLAHRFPDGQLFIDLHGYTDGYEPRTPGEALDWFLRALDVPPNRIPQDVEERAALYRQHLADSRTLILLDNAADEAQVRPLLPGSVGCLVIVTSRRRLKGLDEAHTLALDVLPRVDALALLYTAVGAERAGTDDPVLGEIADLCGRLPLALRIAAALLRHRRAWRLEHLAGLLRDQRQRLTALSDGHRDLGAVFDLSYYALDERHRLLFRLLGVVPGPDVEPYAGAALIDTDAGTTTRLLEDLVDQNLLVQHTAGRYQLHDLLRAHAQAILDQTNDHEAALSRLLDYYQHTANRADRIIARHTRAEPTGPVPRYGPDLPDADSARAWLRAERANLHAALQHSTRTADDECVVALTSGLANLLRLDGPWTEAITLQAAAAAAAERLDDRYGQATALNHLGTAQRVTNDLPGATRNLLQALGLYRDLADRAGQAHALSELGVVRVLSGDLTGATRDLRGALNLSREVGDRAGQAYALTFLGIAGRAGGDLTGAARDLQEALHLYRAVDDRPGQATTLTALGEAQRMAGNPTGAARNLQAALDLCRDLRDLRGQANALTFLGVAKRASGDPIGAARDLQQALDICRDLDERNGQANALTFLGDARRAGGDPIGAAGDLQEALQIYRQLGARGNEAVALNRYAAVFTATGDHPQARTHFGEALRLARETQQPDEQAVALEGIGESHTRTGDIETGRAHLKEAFDIFSGIGMRADADRIAARLTQLAND